MNDIEKAINLVGGYAQLKEQKRILENQIKQTRKAIVETLLRGTNLNGDVIYAVTGERGRFVIVDAPCDSDLNCVQFRTYTKKGTLSERSTATTMVWWLNNDRDLQRTYEHLTALFKPAG